MSVSTSSLYAGLVMHKRLRPFTHRFTYRVRSMLIDLDEVAGLDRRLRLFGHNRLRPFSFHDADHGPRDGSPLRPWIDARLVEAGIDIAGGPVRILCFPRVLGYVFNPISVWFCHRPDGSLAAILHEVSNTFGEHHCYLIPVPADDAASGRIQQSCDKGFYVSPFIEMDSHYRFSLRVPDDRLSVVIRQSSEGQELLVASLSGVRRPLTDTQLFRLLVVRPHMTIKVMAAIHWEALRLWRKGARFMRRPCKPDHLVTIVDGQPDRELGAPAATAHTR